MNRRSGTFRTATQGRPYGVHRDVGVPLRGHPYIAARRYAAINGCGDSALDVSCGTNSVAM